MDITYAWRGDFPNEAVNRLHAEGFGHRLLDDDWVGQVHRHSLGWVCAVAGEELIGFVNVAWDGGVHACARHPGGGRRPDSWVAPGRHGVGRRLVEVAVEHAREAGCEWLHVDFEDELRPFYFDACGFTPTNAGLVEL